jgi:competence protein ComEC
VARVALPSVLVGVVVGILLADAGAGAGSWALLGAAGGLVAAAAAVAPWHFRSAGVGLGLVLIGIAVGGSREGSAALPVGPGSVTALVGQGALDVEGTLTDEPRAHQDRQQAVIGDVSVAGPVAGPIEGRILLWLPRSTSVGAGDRVRLQVSLEEPEDFDGFGYRAYLARQGIGAVASVYELTVVGHERGAIAELLGAVRHTLLSGLYALVPEPEAAVGGGILLGERTAIAPDVSDAFARAGLTHVVAISGWNIAIVAALAASLTRPLAGRPGGRLAGIGIATTAVGAYVLLVGASPSVVRAALMAGALVMARLGGSRAHAIGALQLAVLTMLLAAPMVLWDVGFQLSALATAGLIWFAAPIEARLARWPRMVREPVALTLAAQLTTLPVILLNFERLSVVAPLANVLVVPLVPLVMLLTAGASLIGVADGAVHVSLLGDLLARAAGGAAWLYLRAMIAAGEAAAALPFASVDLGPPVWFAFIWYPGLAAWQRRQRHAPADEEEPRTELPTGAGWLRPVPLAVATLCLLGLITVASQPDGRLHLTVLDIGQGDALLVQAPSGATMLIDGGPDPELAMRRLGDELPFWRRRIDIVLLTHPHEDHVAGLMAVLDRYEVGSILDSGRPHDSPTYPRFLAASAVELGASFGLARAGDAYRLDRSTVLTVLYPTQADADAPLIDDDINNASIVLLLESGSFSALLTGDAKQPVERLLAERGQLRDVDVLKVGHHGSDSSTGVEFLDLVRPEIAVISCGTGNPYGHPHAITLEHLAAVPGLATYRTDLDGTVRIVASGDRIEVTHTQPIVDPGSIGLDGHSHASTGGRDPAFVGAAGWDRHPLTWRDARGASRRPARRRRRHPHRPGPGRGGRHAARPGQAAHPSHRGAARPGRCPSAGRDGISRARPGGRLASGQLPGGR